MTTTTKRVAIARRYLVDAVNAECSMHTRYSSAMNALGCLAAAGLADEDDKVSLGLWETIRHEPRLDLNAFQLGSVVERVNELLRRGQGKQG